ncbi:hypothetical protein [Thermus tenuipuniceus]|uniref:hypothetical protein n=1 Tax=Thermus tenuipuniceus TaxID=2078690 RepID=UPI000CF8AA85|nr:hypothetical protein [Thermus tenuipuniceus]
MQEVHNLYVHRYVHGDPALLPQALALDPLTGALLELKGIERLFRGLVKHQISPLPGFLHSNGSPRGFYHTFAVHDAAPFFGGRGGAYVSHGLKVGGL